MTSLKAFFSQILREPTKLAVIGSGCSPATEPTAEISHFYNISQVSLSTTSLSAKLCVCMEGGGGRVHKGQNCAHIRLALLAC